MRGNLDDLAAEGIRFHRHYTDSTCSPTRVGLLTGLTLIFALAADFLLAPALLILVTRTRYGRTLTERWSRA